tara:strand:+ start:2093 stop:3439 length:1347 start_codon:yes stop_codon:yes gene_type:complete
MAVTISGVQGALTPAPKKQTLSTNYLGADIEFTSQNLPDIYEAEFEKYGNRTVSSFLRLVGAEIPFASDLIQWSEQSRLHIAVTGATRAADVITSTAHAFRKNQTVIISDGTTQDKAIVLDDADFTADTFALGSYTGANLNAAIGTTGLKVFVYGSEFKKGTAGMDGAIEAPVDIQSCSPIIIKDKYEVNGSDMAQIGWVEITTENGAAGYYWYLKSEHETRLRFEDYLELSLIEGVEAAAGSGALAAGAKGTQGMFDTIETRGNIATGSIAGKDDLEQLVLTLDKEGAIQENVMFVNRAKSFEIDNVLAGLNTYGTAGAASFGLFDNDADMALNLGFSGFNLGYDFYKTDWKYLNDASTGGLSSGVDGVVVPAGTMTVYDQVLGKNAKRPFLHVRYRKSESEDRRYKSWVVGSAGGAANSDLDAMQVHMLSERALCVMGANNFIIMK